MGALRFQLLLLGRRLAAHIRQAPLTLIVLTLHLRRTIRASQVIKDIDTLLYPLWHRRYFLALYRLVVVGMMAVIMTAATVIMMCMVMAVIVTAATVIMVCMVMAVVVTAATVIMVCMVMAVIMAMVTAASIYRIPSFLFHGKILLN